MIDKTFMKRRILAFIFILFVSFSQVKTVFAQSDTSVATQSPSIQMVNYDLPYPGLLPDNPLYFLKTFRDKIIELLITNPEKKAEFYLLSSDKRMNVGYYLIQKDKDTMGVLYISKSNNYMHMAILSAKDAGTSGTSILSKMLTSIKKHEEVAKDLEGKVDKKNISEIENEIKRMEDFTLLIKGK